MVLAKNKYRLFGKVPASFVENAYKQNLKKN